MSGNDAPMMRCGMRAWDSPASIRAWARIMTARKDTSLAAVKPYGLFGGVLPGGLDALDLALLLCFDDCWSCQCGSRSEAPNSPVSVRM